VIDPMCTHCPNLEPSGYGFCIPSDWGLRSDHHHNNRSNLQICQEWEHTVDLEHRFIDSHRFHRNFCWFFHTNRQVMHTPLCWFVDHHIVIELLEDGSCDGSVQFLGVSEWTRNMTALGVLQVWRRWRWTLVALCAVCKQRVGIWVPTSQMGHMTSNFLRTQHGLEAVATLLQVQGTSLLVCKLVTQVHPCTTTFFAQIMENKHCSIPVASGRVKFSCMVFITF
jgi:hypothetical protein